LIEKAGQYHLGGMGEFRLVSTHKRFLSPAGKLLFFLSWIQQLVALSFTDKEPSHDRLRLGRSSIREGDRNVEAASIAHSRNRIESRY